MSEADDRLEALFAATAGLPPPERVIFLDQSCANDPALRQRVEALLRAHDRPQHFLDRPAAANRINMPLLSALPGTIIAGRYKLLQEIGEGGMGAVWVAEQTEPVKRKVAIKLIKPGMDSRTVLARFETERQALALMDHPNIAKVLDAGVTDGISDGRLQNADLQSAICNLPSEIGAGRPYFAMEYVKGVPITNYCDTARLTVPERLQLFVSVCKAVQHAHQKGVIHRDLKPSNILVAPYDGTPVPKVIDFGLAKAVDQTLTDRTLHTAHDTVLGTTNQPPQDGPCCAGFGRVSQGIRSVRDRVYLWAIETRWQ